MGAKVNWHKGLFRITLIVSIVAGISGFTLYGYNFTYEQKTEFWIEVGGFATFCFASVWVVYFALRFILKGFRS